MALTRYKIGQLVSLVDERNQDGIKEFYGININKEFMPTVANTEGLDESKYKVVRKGRFVYSGMQTGRDECIRVSMYTGDCPIIVSPAYITFEITAKDIVLPSYFFMKFLSKERDRYGAFCSDGSIRSNLDWEVFCDIELELPPVEVQQKYVDIYNSMVENRRSYERGLNDLKLVCDSYIDKLRKESSHCKLGHYVSLCEETNSELIYGLNSVRGISIEKKFINTKANMDGVSLSSYYIVRPNEFAYVTVTSRNGEKISLARNDSNESFLCSSTYVVFKVNDVNTLLPEYLSMLFERNEFNRYARFNSWGSARETFDWDEMCNVSIPIPRIELQQDIVNIYKAFQARKMIYERLAMQINNICPILIKGSIEEENEKEA